jgi:hypothetical protein
MSRWFRLRKDDDMRCRGSWRAAPSPIRSGVS